ncbi:MAG: hypothetical protein P1P89_12265 [Desulfobacterales bacterium]|nr:hypothetical protein [Desulfobacterales bacterium]
MNLLRVDLALQCQTAGREQFHFILKASFFFLLLTIALPGIHVPAADAAESQINCRIHDGACTRSLPGLDVTLDIRPKPVKAMQDLVFKVSLAGEGPDQTPYIDLGMPGMKMGPNRVILEKTSRTEYSGKGVIVRCPSGRRTWQTTVTVPGRGKADFIFDVIY